MFIFPTKNVETLFYKTSLKQSTIPASSFLDRIFLTSRFDPVRGYGKKKTEENSQASYRESKRGEWLDALAVHKPRRVRFRFLSSAAERAREDYRRVVRLRTGHAISLVELPAGDNPKKRLGSSGSWSGFENEVERGETRTRGRILVTKPIAAVKNEHTRRGKSLGPSLVTGYRLQRNRFHAHDAACNKCSEGEEQVEGKMEKERERKRRKKGRKRIGGKRNSQNAPSTRFVPCLPAWNSTIFRQTSPRERERERERKLALKMYFLNYFVLLQTLARENIWYMLHCMWSIWGFFFSLSLSNQIQIK